MQLDYMQQTKRSYTDFCEQIDFYQIVTSFGRRTPPMPSPPAQLRPLVALLPRPALLVDEEAGGVPCPHQGVPRGARHEAIWEVP
jgi:hypothetical protein